MRASAHHRGYTLIELLAVVAILAIVAALVLPALARRAAGDPLDDAAQTVRGAESHLRRLAIGSGVSLDLRRDGLATAGKDMLAGNGGLRLDPAITCDWRDGRDQPVHRLDIDRRARSVDVMLVLDDGRRRRRYLLRGLTGTWQDAEGVSP